MQNTRHAKVGRPLIDYIVQLETNPRKTLSLFPGNQTVLELRETVALQ